MRQVSDDERRARLAVRQALAPASRVDSPVAATRAMTALHATESATVHLSCWARVDGLGIADVDRALYDDRELVKQLAMRRTLFVFPRDLLPAVWPSASARVAGIERARMAKEIVREGLADDEPVAYALINAMRLDEAQVGSLEISINNAGDPEKGVRQWLEEGENRELVRPWVTAAKNAQED